MTLTALNNSSLGNVLATSFHLQRRTTPNQVTQNTIREEQVVTDSDSSDGILSEGSYDDDDTTDGSDNDDDDSVLIPETPIEWVKFGTGTHETVPYDGPITDLSPPDIQRNGMANKDFFVDEPDPVDCFLTFLPLSFWDEVAKWTEQKFAMEGHPQKVDRADILGLLVIWFLSRVVTLPSTELMFKLGIGQVLKLIQISSQDSNCLPKEF